MSKYVYVTYIGAAPEKVWNALREPQSTKAYWFGHYHETTWEKGAPWRLILRDGVVGYTGEILEIEKPRRIVFKWRCDFIPDLQAEGHSRCTFDVDTAGGLTRLTVTQEIDVPDSKLIALVSIGWPKIISSMKTFLETGTVLDVPLN